jgi:hypothetical protein
MKYLIKTCFIGSLAMSSCAPVNKTNLNPAPKSEELSASDAPGSSSSVTAAANAPTGRFVDLYAIRASSAKGFVPPEIDKLPCPFFKQGAPFQIPAVPGGPPIALPGPLQNHYSGFWNGLDQYHFKVSAYNRLYRDPGIPDWLLSAPTVRAIEYVSKLFDVTINNPTKATCSISARPLN